MQNAIIVVATASCEPTFQDGAVLVLLVTCEVLGAEFQGGFLAFPTSYKTKFRSAWWPKMPSKYKFRISLPQIGKEVKIWFSRKYSLQMLAMLMPLTTTP